MNYVTIPVTAFAQNCSLIWCDASHEAAIVDPGGDADTIIAEVAARPITVTQILLTHGHLDHVGAAVELAQHFGVPLVGPQQEDRFWLEALPVQSQMFGLAECAPFTPDRWLEEGEIVQVGEMRLEVLHCPGHTPGHIVFVNRAARLMISGDVIFRGGVGRTDFPRGSHEALIDAIRTKLLPLGDEMTFLPGHGPSSTLGHERLTNPFLQ
ncbi:MBL fold metallo-hydrolase [Nissabacter sp. SGAir0207]|uniref:MBL fold metallo-hydrolase n=1 Tax=Nissabacter sp. SGAir0207 TaxID=2126321 RepID=UPI0010CD4503|nr:MBL fold metallo-hydrolase [Nissabacter sp. SGAir0207]QCR36538.1 hypothetical protein C1N62_10740 [Nissabacter sp. SGAir0207]